MYGYIYLIINLINNMKYIGQKTGSPDESKLYFGSGLHLKRAIKKYGKENFKKEILCECETQEELDEMEISYIAEVDAMNSPEYYNIVAGGGGTTGYKHTEKTIKKLSEINKGENNPMFGLFGENSSFYGRQHTAATKAQISKTKRNMDDETRSHYVNAARNMPVEQRKKIAGSMVLYHIRHKTWNQDMDPSLIPYSKMWLLISPTGEKIHSKSVRSACMKYELNYKTLLRTLITQNPTSSSCKHKNNVGWQLLRAE